MHLIDTHCHIHSSDYQLDANEVYVSAQDSGVNRLICIGTDLEDSKLAVAFAGKHENVWSSIGIHPHEADKFVNRRELLNEFSQLVSAEKVVAIGECGLDYFYNHSSKESQVEILKYQIELAVEHNLPLSFHVREAYDDFWPIVDRYTKLRGVLHSFTDSQANLSKAIERGLFIGVNGIATFTKNEQQIAMYKQIPLTNLMLETDSPYLTPVPFRGMICEPKYIKVVADFLANLRGETSEAVANQTTINARALFEI